MGRKGYSEDEKKKEPLELNIVLTSTKIHCGLIILKFVYNAHQLPGIPLFILYVQCAVNCESYLSNLPQPRETWGNSDAYAIW